jgi:rpsU-divergently transcribed protein
MKKQNNSNNKIKSIILQKLKKIVSDEGWSEKVLKQLLQNGVEKSDLVTFFQYDYKELLKYSLEELNKSLEKEINKINIINYSLNKRIKKILMLRLNILNNDKEFYKKTFYHLLIPSNNKIMKSSLYKSVDTMWYLAGDNSTDFNFYTKRLILAVIYVNALFVLFNKNFDEVESNIERNLKKISKIPKIKDRISFIKDNIPVFFKSFLN